MKKFYDNFDSILNAYGRKLPYENILVIGMSSRKIGFTEAVLRQIEPEEVCEFRCFDENGELHGIRIAGGFSVTEINEGTFKETGKYDFTLYCTEKLAQPQNGNNKIQIRRYVKYDEDGQGYIIASRCMKFVK